MKTMMRMSTAELEEALLKVLMPVPQGEPLEPALL
jgi:hypothetical protein